MAVDKVKALTEAAQGLEKFYGGLTPGAGGDEQAAASQQLFDAVFQALLIEAGPTEALRIAGPALEALKAALPPGTTLTGGAADADRWSKIQ